MRRPSDPLSWKRARAVFEEVAGLGPLERDGRLAERCGDDDALRAEVESLLAYDATPGDVISAIIGQAALAATAGSSLHVGQTLLHYAVSGELGKGGMGVVWKATDRTLGRDVAIKVLPSAVSKDPSRLARFDREAKVLASLNHANIAAIYSLHESDGMRFLAMEYIEGDDLTVHIARGGLSLPDVLSVARQVADGLEEAHEKGVVHRDLKPANIKITPAGKVKVLDFGLAKAMGPDVVGTATEDSASRAALSALASSTGLILGTAAYMPPEQARGLAVDRRADIWSFGVLLFEMLAGQRPFAGATLTDVLAAIVSTEPDWTRLPTTTPLRLERLIRRCLEKDPRQRLRDIGDARIEIEQLISGRELEPAAVRQAPARSRRRDVLLSLGGAVAAGLAVFLLLRPTPDADPGTQRFNVALPPGLRLDDAQDAGRQALALSRDGRQLAFVTRSAAGKKQIYVRRMDRVDAEAVAGTDGGDMPFFSPDGAQLGFASEGKLKRVPLNGGTPAVIADAPQPRGATWVDDDSIVFTPTVFSGLVRVSASGASPRPLTTLAPTEESHRWPIVLPGGRAVLFGAMPLQFEERNATIDLVRLDTGARRTLLRGGIYPRFLDGRLLYGYDGRLLAAPFDLTRLELTGPGAPVLDDVRMDLWPARRVFMDVSASGSLAYVPGALRLAERELVWLDRRGAATRAVSEKRAYKGSQLSPNGRSLAVLIEGAPTTSLWNYSVDRGTWHRLTFDQDVSTPAWTPDGARILYSSDGERATFAVAANGGGKPVRLTRESTIGGDMPAIAPNGRLALVSVQDRHGDDIVSVTLDGRHAIAPFQADDGNEASPAFSPDGRYVAYSSTASGRREVYIRPFSGPVHKWPVSIDGGGTPRWRGDGRELFFLAGARMMAVPVNASATGLTIGAPAMLFDDPSLVWSGADGHSYDVSADGQRFLMIRPDPLEVRPLQLVVIPRFAREMRARLAGRP
jgi:Tol biopolymer transport system component/predicted Ser/Thr protein kinase